MLNEEICKACINRSTWGAWTGLDSAQWRRKRVRCPASWIVRGIWETDIQRVPEFCPFIVEHAVSQDAE